MIRNLNYQGEEYQFRYEITGAINLTEGIALYIKSNSKWNHLADYDYFDLEETDKEKLIKMIDNEEKFRG